MNIKNDDLEAIGITAEMLKLKKVKDAVEAVYNAENIESVKINRALVKIEMIVGKRKTQQVLDIVSPARQHRQQERLLELAGFMGNHTFLEIVETYDLALQALFHQE